MLKPDQEKYNKEIIRMNNEIAKLNKKDLELQKSFNDARLVHLSRLASKKVKPMSYTDREENENLSVGKTVEGAIFVSNSVNPRTGKIVARWTLMSEFKWLYLFWAESLLFSAMLVVTSFVSPLLPLILVIPMITLLLPQFGRMILTRQKKMIVLDDFEGFGSIWQSELKSSLRSLNKLYLQSIAEDSSEEIKKAYDGIEPLIWGSAIKVSTLLKKLDNTNMQEVDEDTRSILRTKLVAYKKQIKEMESVAKVATSYSMLTLDLEMDVVDTENIADSLRNRLTFQKALQSVNGDFELPQAIGE